MSAIHSDNKVHDQACMDSEQQRQAAVATATTPAQIATAEIAHYRRIVSSCKANSLPFGNFIQALINLGTGGA